MFMMCWDFLGNSKRSEESQVISNFLLEEATEKEFNLLANLYNSQKSELADPAAKIIIGITSRLGFDPARMSRASFKELHAMGWVSNLREYEQLRRISPEGARYLQEVFGIYSFHKYRQENLVNQFETRDKDGVHIMVLHALWDPEGAFGSRYERARTVKSKISWTSIKVC